MIETINKKIEQYMNESYGDYSLTTDTQIEKFARKLDSDFSYRIDTLSIKELHSIFAKELNSDFDIFYELTGNMELAQLYIDLAYEMDIPLSYMLNSNEYMKIYVLGFNEFIEYKIMTEKIFDEVKEEHLIYFDYEQVWQDKFQDNHYISGHDCIVEFIKKD